ncbi:MAG: hypothetical protein AAF399_17920 [Bacteroidota bacterium]
MVTLLLSQQPPQSFFPGTIFAGKQEKLLKNWLDQVGMVPHAAALSNPLAATTKPQPIAFVENIPDDLYQRPGIEWPSANSAPKIIPFSSQGQALSTHLIWSQAPKESRFAVVVLLLADGQQVQAEEPSVMLVFF